MLLARPAVVSRLGGVSLDGLLSAYEREGYGKARLRLLAGIMRKRGRTIEEIAFELNRPVMTVHNWLRRLGEGELERIYDKKQSGRPPRLAKKDLRRLKRGLTRGPQAFGYRDYFWTTRMVQDFVKRRYGVFYGERHMTRLLHKLGFSCQKPRPRHYKADREVQERFKKTSAKSSGDTRSKDMRSSVWTSTPSS